MPTRRRYMIFGIRIPLLVCFLTCSLQATTIWESDTINGRIEKAVFDAEAGRMACRLSGGRVLIRDLGQPGSSRMFSTEPYEVAEIAISGDGSAVVWGDIFGRLYRWAHGKELLFVDTDACALTGLTVSPDGSMVAVASSGVAASLRATGGLSVERSRALSLGQVRALAMDPSGENLLAADHAGLLQRVDMYSASRSSGRLDSIGARGALNVEAGQVEWVVWDEAGSLFFLDAALVKLATVELGNSPVTASHYEAAGQELWLGFRNGSLLLISLAEGNLGETTLLAEFEEPVVGLGGKGDGTVLVMTESGRLLASGESGFSLVSEPAFEGQPLRLQVSLMAGIASIMTDRGDRILSLANGSRQARPVPSDGIILDSAIFHGFSGSGPIHLILDPDSLELRLDGKVLPAPIPIEGWTPDRIAADAWSPRIALMSALGEVRLIEQTRQGFSREVLLYSPITTLWEDVEFDQNGEIQRRQAEATTSLPAPDGPFRLDLGEEGGIAFARLEADPALLTWPDLSPSPNGGMQGGFLGRIRALRHPWFLQREFGWGYVLPFGGISWFWFPGEGWLAGSPDFGSWLFSETTGDWIYTLVDDTDCHWIYDFAGKKWRQFGQGE